MIGSEGARILVVDDEPSIQRALRTILVRHGFQVEIAASGARALDLCASWHPDLVLLDLGLPDMEGTEVISRIRSHRATPIIVLSVRGAERDKVAALDLGADDYLTKPFGVEELMARIRVALRHAARPASGATAVFQTGGLTIDFEKRRVTMDGREIHLTPTEYDLLKVFANNPNKVLTSTMLLRQVWGPSYSSEGHYLHVYVARLRNKLEPDPQNPRYLLTDPGVGYRLLVGED